jgi:hypothetical protein
LLVIPAKAGIQYLQAIECKGAGFLLDQPSAVEKRLAGMTSKKPIDQTFPG